MHPLDFCRQHNVKSAKQCKKRSVNSSMNCPLINDSIDAFFCVVSFRLFSSLPFLRKSRETPLTGILVSHANLKVAILKLAAAETNPHLESEGPSPEIAA